MIWSSQSLISCSSGTTASWSSQHNTTWISQSTAPSRGSLPHPGGHCPTQSLISCSSGTTASWSLQHNTDLTVYYPTQGVTTPPMGSLPHPVLDLLQLRDDRFMVLTTQHGSHSLLPHRGDYCATEGLLCHPGG